MPSPKTMTTQEQSQQTIDLTAAAPAAVERPVTQSINRDRFAAPEYVNPNARLPRIQALRGGVIRSV